VLGNDRVPVSRVREADDNESGVLHPGRDRLVPLLAIGEVVGRPIHVDRDPLFVVDEVRPGGDSRDELLGVARQVETAPGEVIEPLAFEVAPRLLLQGFEMLRESACGGGRRSQAGWRFS